MFSDEYCRSTGGSFPSTYFLNILRCFGYRRYSLFFQTLGRSFFILDYDRRQIYIFIFKYLDVTPRCLSGFMWVEASYFVDRCCQFPYEKSVFKIGDVYWCQNRQMSQTSQAKNSEIPKSIFLYILFGFCHLIRCFIGSSHLAFSIKISINTQFTVFLY